MSMSTLHPAPVRDATRDASVLPAVIQGGMGVGVSSWRLASTVACHGGLGVVSGVAADLMMARWLQDGDEGGDVRAALAAYPDQQFATSTLRRYFRPNGREAGEPYRPIPRLDHHQRDNAVKLAVLGAFVQVWLAKRGHDRPIGINLLEKIQLWTPSTLYGAMLAGVDVVLVGAGIPAHIPALLNDLALGARVEVPIDVVGATDGRNLTISFDPGAVVPGARDLLRPTFLAIISSHALAGYLARDPATTPDGFVIEAPEAGGHNAPPRRPAVDEHGEVVYGERDVADLDKVERVGLPFWLAGGKATPQLLDAARAMGAHGVQIGTAFALCEESGLSPTLRKTLLATVADGSLNVRTDPKASPTGFPFKVAQVHSTVSEASVYEERQRICDLGYLRVCFEKPDGTIAQRCPSEPIEVYQRKGGAVDDTEGRLCLCNGLTASAGLGQTRPDGTSEPPLLTLGHDLASVRELLAAHPDGWSAVDVMRWLR